MSDCILKGYSGKVCYTCDVNQRPLQSSCGLHSFIAFICYKEHRIGKIFPRSSCCFSQCRIYSVLFHLGLDCDLFNAENFPALVKALRAPILSCSDQPSPTHFLPSDLGAVFQLRPGPCLSYIIRIALSPGLSLALSLG